MVHITINGKPVEAPENSTIMEAAASAGIKIPSLCHLKDVHAYGSCRICVVEVEGMRNLQASCIAKVREGMVIKTNSPKVRASRKVLYELLLSDHPKDCLNCNRNQNCELQELGYELGVTESRFEGETSKSSIDIAPSITRDTSKCILCRRCVTVCNKIQHVGAIQAQNRGFDTVISPAMGLPLNSVDCAMCGQCTVVCPTGALPVSYTHLIGFAFFAQRDLHIFIRLRGHNIAICILYPLPTGDIADGQIGCCTLFLNLINLSRIKLIRCV